MARSDLESAQPSSYRYPDSVRADELLLRAPTEADIDIVAPAFRDPAVGGEAGLPLVDADALRVMLREQLPWMRERGLLAPYLIEDSNTGKILGGANLRLFDPLRDTVEVGYWLFVDARDAERNSSRAGTRRQCVRKRLVRVEAHVRIGNAPSERVLERVGFEREGIKRNLLRHGGARVDATLFAIVASDV